jgi:hypothetical protein
MKVPDALGVAASGSKLPLPPPLLLSLFVVSIYPKDDPTMSDLEKVLTYQQCFTALATAGLNQGVCILALAKQLGLILSAQPTLVGWKHKLAKNWFNFANLTSIFWHDARGAIINCTTLTNDTSILLPMQDGPVGQCHMEGLKHV